MHTCIYAYKHVQTYVYMCIRVCTVFEARVDKRHDVMQLPFDIPKRHSHTIGMDLHVIRAPTPFLDLIVLSRVLLLVFLSLWGGYN